MSNPFVPSTSVDPSEDFIPFDERAQYAWVDGKIVRNKDAKTHILNHTLHYSGAVFEGVRIYDGNIFLLAQHTQRLLEGIEAHKFSVPFTFDQINQACRDTVKATGVTNGYIRPIAYLGSEDLFVQGLRSTKHLAIAAFDLEVAPADLTLKTAELRRAGADALLVHSKCSEVFAAGRLGKMEAAEAGYNDIMFLDQQGYIADSSAANIFFVFNGELHTPSPENILPGITQKVIIKRARDFGYKVIQRKIKPEEITNATEVFICGTAMEVHSVIKIDDMDIPKGSIGARFIADYNELVRKPEEEVDRILGISGGIGL